MQKLGKQKETLIIQLCSFRSKKFQLGNINIVIGSYPDLKMIFFFFEEQKVLVHFLDYIFLCRFSLVEGECLVKELNFLQIDKKYPSLYREVTSFPQ